MSEERNDRAAEAALNEEQRKEKELDIERLIEQRINAGFTAPQHDLEDISDDRLKEFNKTLPDWSLEPPYSHLK